jgi:Ca2+-binding EF-hand superfamily protein
MLSDVSMNFLKSESSVLRGMADRKRVNDAIGSLRVTWQKKLLDMAILFNSFYIATFIANFVYVVGQASEFEVVVKAEVLFVLLFPALLNVFFCGRIIKTQSMLNSMCEIDRHIMGQVIDETEDLLSEGKDIFMAFHKKFDGLEIKKEELAAVFMSFDIDNSGELDAKELELALFEIGIQLGKKRFSKMFRVMDKDKSGAISLEEFMEMCFSGQEIRGNPVDKGLLQFRGKGLSVAS